MNKAVVQDKLIKVVLVQEYEDSDEVDTESPWALDLGNDQYQLKNFPFFFYGLSYDDILRPILQKNMRMIHGHILLESLKSQATELFAFS